MDITFYLVELLRLHDCVIVPDLGGFVTNYRPAEMDLVSNSFKPPVKDIIFTGKLSKNDGLLVNYISETEGVGYLEARQIISEFVDETWSKLENGEKIEFQNIGSLQYDRNEKLIFEPEIHENFLLEAYGMEGFQFPQLERHDGMGSKRVFSDKEAVRPVFSSRKVKALIVGVPILLALIFIPVKKYSWKDYSNTQISSTTTLPTSIMGVPANETAVDSVVKRDTPLQIDSTAIQTAAIQASENQPATVQPTTVQPAVVQPAVAQPEPEKVVVKTMGRYRIIGGCFKLRENADKFLAKLQAAGFKAESKVQPNGSFLIIVQSYSDKSEAMTALNGLRQAEPQSGYWLSVN